MRWKRLLLALATLAGGMVAVVVFEYQERWILVIVASAVCAVGAVCLSLYDE